MPRNFLGIFIILFYFNFVKFLAYKKNIPPMMNQSEHHEGVHFYTCLWDTSVKWDERVVIISIFSQKLHFLRVFLLETKTIDTCLFHESTKCDTDFPQLDLALL